jgi:hypothetical protein
MKTQKENQNSPAKKIIQYINKPLQGVAKIKAVNCEQLKLKKREIVNQMMRTAEEKHLLQR